MSLSSRSRRTMRTYILSLYSSVTVLRGEMRKKEDKFRRDTKHTCYSTRRECPGASLQPRSTLPPARARLPVVLAMTQSRPSDDTFSATLSVYIPNVNHTCSSKLACLANSASSIPLAASCFASLSDIAPSVSLFTSTATTCLDTTKATES